MSHFAVLAACQLPDGLFENGVPVKPPELKSDELPEIPDSPEGWLAALVKHGGLRQFDDIVRLLVEIILTPYDAGSENPKHLEFKSAEERERPRYEMGKATLLRMADGRIIPTYSPLFWEKYVLHDGQVYQSCVGRLHRPKRTKRAKRMKVLQDYPYRRAYATFAAYMAAMDYVYNEEKQAFGYYFNPYAEWDWYRIGGGWSHVFLVKRDCPAVYRGSIGLVPQKDGGDFDAPAGYRWVAGARKGDIQWDMMKQLQVKASTQAFQRLEICFNTGQLPSTASGYKITAEGIAGQYGLVYKKGDTLSDYLARQHLGDNEVYLYNTYAFVDKDGWRSVDDLNHDGMDHQEQVRIWRQKTQSFLASLSDDTLLVSVDCHI